MERPASMARTMVDATRLLRSITTPAVKWLLAISIALSVAVAIAGALAPLALKFTIDALAAKQQLELVQLLIAAYVALMWLSRLFGAAQGYALALADRGVHRNLSDRYFNHIIRLPLSFHLERQTGAVNESLNNGLLGYQIVLQMVLSGMVSILIQLIVVAGVLASLDQGVLLFLVLGASVAYVIVYARGAVQGNRAAREAAGAHVDARAQMVDAAINFETVKIFTAERLVGARVANALRASEAHSRRYQKVRALNLVWVSSIYGLFLWSALAYAASQFYAGGVSLGAFVLVNSYLLQLIAPVEMAGAATQAIAQGLAYIDRMLQFLRESPEPEIPGERRTLEGPCALSFENVSARYQDRETLRDLSFTLPAGASLGVVGPSGAGKTTFVRLLARLIEPSSGRILLDGVPHTDLDLDTVRGAVAVVPQDTVLFADTIAANIAFGRAEATQAEIEDAARLAGLHEFIVRLPLGYETRVGERGERLSGGERQRLSIARAILKRPRIYVFDEATSSLDLQTERLIHSNIRELTREVTSVTIAHRLSAVIHADLILYLEEGRILEQGTHEELLALKGRYAMQFAAQGESRSLGCVG